MKEDFLHYAWKFQKFSSKHLVTVQNEPLQIVEVGQHNLDAGPDFYFGKVRIGGQLWVGTIEIHVRSSLWYSHGHETDARYDNVVLHVVWEHDMEIKRRDESVIPTLALKGRISKAMREKYHYLMANKQQWINCATSLQKVDSFVVDHWLSRLYFERLEYKSEAIVKLLSQYKNNWELVLFRLLCKNFGLKVNGASFDSIGASIPSHVLQKVRREPLQLEALLMGQAGLLCADYVDPYHQKLKEVYAFLCVKFRISNAGVIPPKYFRLRPSNFPSIRLAQLAALFSKFSSIFSEVISAKTVGDYQALFDVAASDYWDTHYNFGVASKRSRKKFSKSFVNLLVINSVIPLKHSHSVHLGVDYSEEILGLATSLALESNRTVQQFVKLRSFEATAVVSQGLLHLKQHYCDQRRCLQCAIGNELLKEG